MGTSTTRAYLDGASTQPLRPEARAALLEAWTGPLGDPGRIHTRTACGPEGALIPMPTLSS